VNDYEPSTYLERLVKLLLVSAFTSLSPIT